MGARRQVSTETGRANTRGLACVPASGGPSLGAFPLVPCSPAPAPREQPGSVSSRFTQPAWNPCSQPRCSPWSPCTAADALFWPILCRFQPLWVSIFGPSFSTLHVCLTSQQSRWFGHECWTPVVPQSSGLVPCRASCVCMASSLSCSALLQAGSCLLPSQ